MPPDLMPEYLTALRRIVPQLVSLSYPWAITGSLGQALQGVPLTPHDIDLQTTQEGAFEIEKRLSPYVTEPVREKAGPLLRSYFGRMVVEGIQVEVMGDIRKAQPDGSWDEPPSLEEVITWVEVEGFYLPVVSLAYEVEAYRKMGRLERAALLEDWLQRDSGVGDHALEPVLSKYPPEIQELCGQLRRVIFELVPEAVEKPYPGWRTIGYSFSGGMKSQFCALGPMKTYVNLYLPQGADLDDPEHLLEGAGKKMRHIKIRRLEDARREPVTAMIRQAAERCKP